MFELIGWLGVGFIMLVNPPQLYKMIKTGKSGDIAIWTYIFLICALICYLIYAIDINRPVFIVAQSINLITTSAILVLKIKHLVN